MTHHSGIEETRSARFTRGFAACFTTIVVMLAGAWQIATVVAAS